MNTETQKWETQINLKKVPKSKLTKRFILALCMAILSATETLHVTIQPRDIETLYETVQPRATETLYVTLQPCVLEPLHVTIQSRATET